MKITEVLDIADKLSKLKPEEMAGVVQQQMAPAMQMLSGISNSLDDLNANLRELIQVMKEKP